MKRRDFLGFIALLGLSFNRGFSGVLDAFRKHKSSLPPPGKYTPASQLFIVDIKGVPNAIRTLKDYTLRVYGKVENPRYFTIQDLKSLPTIRKEVVLECVSNSKGDKIGRILVEGVDLNTILSIVKPLQKARKVVFRSFDDYHTSIEIPYVKELSPILAYGINYDEDGKVIDRLPLDHGYPVRVVCPEKWGYKSVKWIKEIEIVDYDYKGYWEKTGWNDRATRGVDYFDYN
ncbi:MAG: molybdopterin-dependent oxidoreductase [Hydrogenothermaceae bacterium]|nr:molybdopterin-dependent oxidoreductase [Hydrogenothermaceae bacterium]